MFIIGIKRLIRRLKYIPTYIKESFTDPGESCYVCGSVYKLLWTATDDLYKKVNGGYGKCYCIECFIKKAHLNKHSVTLNTVYIKYIGEPMKNIYKKPEAILNEKVSSFNKTNNAKLSIKANRANGFNLYGDGDKLLDGSIEYLIGVVDGMRITIERNK